MKPMKGFIEITDGLWMRREHDKIIKLVVLGQGSYQHGRLLCEILHPVHGQIDRASFNFRDYPKSKNKEPSLEMTEAIRKYVRLFDKDYYEVVNGIG